MSPNSKPKGVQVGGFPVTADSMTATASIEHKDDRASRIKIAEAAAALERHKETARFYCITLLTVAIIVIAVYFYFWGPEGPTKQSASYIITTSLGAMVGYAIGKKEK